MRRLVYLDNNTTTQVATEVVDAMKPYFIEKYGHPNSIHTLGLDAADALRRSGETIAKAVGASAEGGSSPRVPLRPAILLSAVRSTPTATGATT